MARTKRLPQWIRVFAPLIVTALVAVGCTSQGGDDQSDVASGTVSPTDAATPPAVSPPVAGGGGAIELPNQERRNFSASADCKTCHPRQFEEWRTSPHAYSGISPTFYSLVAAGQNSFGAGLLPNLLDAPPGVSLAGGVGNFCLPCHAPLAFTGNGRYGGNNGGFANVEPDASVPLVCSPLTSRAVCNGGTAEGTVCQVCSGGTNDGASCGSDRNCTGGGTCDPNPALCTGGGTCAANGLDPCDSDDALAVCGLGGACVQFEGRTCSNMPPVTPGTLFPRQMVHCTSDADCAGGTNGCPPGEDCGPCVINPATIFYTPVAQEGINCETCHNMLPNHSRSCQLFRNSDSVGVLSIDFAERGAANNGRRTRLGPYPLEAAATDTTNDGAANDRLLPVTNSFHESARVDSPLAMPYDQTDHPMGVANPANTSPHIVRPTALSCEDLPYCGNAGAPGDSIIFVGGVPIAPNVTFLPVCNGGLVIGATCASDFDCGGCGDDPTTVGVVERVCGPNAPVPLRGQACQTSHDCNFPADQTMNLLEVATDPATGDRTLGPLAARPHAGGDPGNELDREDGNFYRSSMYCGACHDVRPPFANSALRSCQLQDSQVCSTDLDCQGLNVGCPGNDCGPCVTENNAPPSLMDGTSPANTVPGVPTDQIDPRNNGYRRVENLFTEWQISAYAHPELRFCEGNAFKACSVDADCVLPGPGFEDEGPCSVESPLGFGGEVTTCQDCHTSNFPETPLVSYTVTNPTDIYDNPGVANASTLSPVPIANKNDLYPMDKAAIEGSQLDTAQELPVRRVSTHFMSGVDLPLVRYPGQQIQSARRQMLVDSGFKIVVDPERNLDDPGMPIAAGDKVRVDIEITNVGVGHRYPSGFSHERQNWVQMYVTEKEALQDLGDIDPFDPAAPCNLQNTIARSAEDARDPVGAVRLENAGCVYRSGFVLDKAHPETGEMEPDGSLDDEDPEDFFVVVGTRMRGDEPSPITATPADARIEVNPGAEGRALSIVNVCEEATAEAYRAAIADNSGLDFRAGSTFPYQARICDGSLSPAIPGEGFRAPDGSGSLTETQLGSGVTAPGYGNPDCMVGGEDLGPCVPEIELSDGNERGRCAGDLTRGTCQSDSECADEGPCLFRCTNFPELMCCDQTDDPVCLTDPDNPACNACDRFYSDLEQNECILGTEGVCVGGTNANEPCFGNNKCAPGGGFCDFEGSCVGGSNDGNLCLTDSSCPGGTCGDVAICIRGSRSGLGCDDDADCPGGACGDVGPCNVENGGIVNFQNQFRTTANGVCVDLDNPRTAQGRPIPSTDPPTSCFLDLTCTLNGQLNGNVGCLVPGQCAADSADGMHFAGDACTNYTYREDCGLDAVDISISCNTQFNLELNGRPSESVFIQNHPFNFNSLPPLEPRLFEYEFEVPAEFAGKDLVISARIMNRHFPMRFLRNLVGTQTVRPPLIVEAQGDPDDPDQCNNARQIDIDCYVRPVTTLGNAEPGGFVPAQQFTRTRTFPVVSP